MALSMYLTVFVCLSVCWPRVVAAAVAASDVAAAGGGDDDAEARIMAEINRQDLRDLSRTLEDDGSPLPNPVPASLLLQILRSESSLQQQKQQPPQEPANDDEDDGLDDNDNNDDDNDDNNKVDKRVFCNGFTGCGGRHRQMSRRRRLLGKRLIPVLVKRPFCTSFGCFNAQSKTPGQYPRARMLPRGLSRMLGKAQGQREEGKRSHGGELTEVGKRVFCNGYWGCRGGKRSLFSPWMSKMSSVADSMR